MYLNEDSFWSICLKVGLSFAFCFQHNSINDDNNTRFWSPFGFGISSLFPERTWYSISDTSFTKKKEKRKRNKIRKEKENMKAKEKKEKDTMFPRNFSCQHFPKNKSKRINISFHFIFNWYFCCITCHSSKYFWCCISWWKSFDIQNLLTFNL